MAPRVTHASPHVAPKPETYVIKAGDSFDSIANDRSVRREALIKANAGLNPNALRIGATITIPHETRRLHASAKHPELRLPGSANHPFTRAELKPAIRAAAAAYRVPAEVLAGVMMQESMRNDQLVNWLTHEDANGFGLCGLDPRGGELEGFTRWSGFHAITRERDPKHKGHMVSVRHTIPPLLQIEYLALRLREKTDEYGGDVWRAVATWHSFDPDEGAKYIAAVKARIASLGK